MENSDKPSASNQFLPWPDLMRIGLGQLKLSPEEFWRTTPKELKYAIEGQLNCLIGHHDYEPLSKKTLDELMQRFPD